MPVGRTSPEMNRRRSRYARLHQSYAHDDPIVIEAKRALDALKVAEHLQRLCAVNASTTDDMLGRVADILHVGATAK